MPEFWGGPAGLSHPGIARDGIGRDTVRTVLHGVDKFWEINKFWCGLSHENYSFYIQAGSSKKRQIVSATNAACNSYSIDTTLASY